MENEKYFPTPIDVSKVELEPHLFELTEILARHAHDLWAAQRIRDGWSWGKERCDKNKTHPCLVPYEKLPESEKEYDRLAAMGTVKAIFALGYELVQPDNAIHTEMDFAALNPRR